jgi:hypothetical protein
MNENISTKGKKYSKSFERDFSFYMENKEKFTFFGGWPPDIIHDCSGVSAKRAFFTHDSTGKIVPTSEPELLQELFVCKKSMNFHIKMWAAGFAEWVLLENDIEEINRDYKCPPWVQKGIEKQGLRMRIKNESRVRNKNKK